MLLSFIIPTANRKKILKETISALLDCISSIQDQTEIIVINDGIQEIDELSWTNKFITIVQNRGTGVASARNYGVSLAKAENLVFMDDDVILTKESLKIILDFFKSNYSHSSCLNIAWIYPNDLLANLTRTSLGRYILKIDYFSMRGWANLDIWKEYACFEIPNAASFLLCLKKKLFLKIGGYTENYPYSGFEDFDFAEKIRQQNIKTFLSTKTYVYHNDQQSLSLSPWLHRRYREGFTRAKYVQITKDANLDIQYSFLKILIFRLLFIGRGFLIKLVNLLNHRFFDPLNFFFLRILTGLYTYKGYKDAQKKIKVFAVFFGTDWAAEFYWYGKYINKEHFELICVFMHSHKPQLMSVLQNIGIRCYWIRYLGKKHIPFAVAKIIALLLKVRPHIIHPQLFESTLVTLFSAKILGFKRLLHTRHHGNYHHVYHPRVVRFDRWNNSWSKHIICPSEHTKHVLINKECVPEKKILVIRHGFDFGDFSIEQKDKLQIYYQIYGKPIIGVVSRLVHWKGVQYGIDAFTRFYNKYSSAILVIVGQDGDCSKEIYERLKKLPNNAYRYIKYEKEIYSLMSLFDIFLHIPITKYAESFGQTYIEAFALGIPSIITLSGIAADDPLFAKYGVIVDYENSDQIVQALEYVWNNYDNFKKSMEEAQNLIRQKYNFEQKINALERTYFTLMHSI